MAATDVVRATAAPLGAAAVALAGAALLYVRDPRTSTYFPCPFHALTGLWCPGCGGIRALGDLTRGDVTAAASSNVVAVVLVIVAFGTWIIWLRSRLTLRPLMIPTPNRRVVIVGIALVVAFTVLRNTSWGTAIAPNSAVSN